MKKKNVKMELEFSQEISSRFLISTTKTNWKHQSIVSDLIENWYISIDIFREFIGLCARAFIFNLWS